VSRPTEAERRTLAERPSRARRPGKRAKVLVVDDHPVVREGLARLINQSPDLGVCGGSGDPREALSLIEKTKPDIIIVDLRLGANSGIELIDSVRARFRRLPILVISMFDESLYAERVLKLGARGYVMKSVAPQKLIEAVRLVLKGQIYVSDTIKDNLLRSAVGKRPVRRASLIASLTNRELEVFQLAGQGLGTRQIAYSLKLSTKTVETYYARIKEKMSLTSSRQLVARAAKWVQNSV
jgi:DNA-binding NarL/FixJ family response regulator